MKNFVSSILILVFLQVTSSFTLPRVGDACRDSPDGKTYANPQRCGTFLICQDGFAIPSSCSHGLYNPELDICDSAYICRSDVDKEDDNVITNEETSNIVDVQIIDEEESEGDIDNDTEINEVNSEVPESVTEDEANEESTVEDVETTDDLTDDTEVTSQATEPADEVPENTEETTTESDDNEVTEETTTNESTVESETTEVDEGENETSSTESAGTETTLFPTDETDETEINQSTTDDHTTEQSQNTDDTDITSEPTIEETDSTTENGDTSETTAQQTETTVTETTVSPTTTTTQAPQLPGEVTCPIKDPASLMFLPSPIDCGRYFLCYHSRPVQMECLHGMHWNQEKKVCDWPENVNCSIENESIPDANNSPKCQRSRGHYIMAHPSQCELYIFCNDGEAAIQQCEAFHHWDVNEERCVIKDRATCILDLNQ